jgi:acyl transferase domain-containing protein
MQHLSSTYDLLTGSALISYRLSLSEHSWLAHYKVFDRVILVGTGLVELALAAGLAVGSLRVVELTLAAPLMISATGGLRVQVQDSSANRRRVIQASMGVLIMLTTEPSPSYSPEGA